MTVTHWLPRVLLIALSLGAWFWSQALIAKRPFPEGRLGDRIHDLTAPWNHYLGENPRAANALLIATSALIDLLAIFLLGLSIFGPSLRPFLGLLILFILRQLCQGICALPPPQGMIWRSPGVPSLLVTYGTASDLFFSGHTAIAVYGCLELAYQVGSIGIAAGVTIALIEMATVLVLRAHYTLDVFTGAVTALWVWSLAWHLAPRADVLLGALFQS
jgi:hypothetical protein